MCRALFVKTMKSYMLTEQAYQVTTSIQRWSLVSLHYTQTSEVHSSVIEFLGLYCFKGGIILHRPKSL